MVLYRTYSVKVQILIKGNPKTAHSLHIYQLIQHPLFPALSRYFNIKYTTFFIFIITYTMNLLSNGAQPKDVQELLGHSAVSATMNVYAHATREAKRESAKLLDKVVGMN